MAQYREIPVKPSRQDPGFTSSVPVDLRKAVGYVNTPLYDCSSPVSSAAEDTFFQVPVGGQLSGSATVKKTLLHTNMKQGGQLAADERFEVHGYGMYITPLGKKDTDGAFPYTLFNAMLNGYVVIKFRGYRDLNYPIISILSSSSPAVHNADATVFWLQQGSPLWKSRGYKPLTKPIILSRSVPVEVRVEWGTAPNSETTNPLLLYFTFWGIQEFAVVS